MAITKGVSGVGFDGVANASSDGISYWEFLLKNSGEFISQPTCMTLLGLSVADFKSTITPPLPDLMHSEHHHDGHRNSGNRQ